MKIERDLMRVVPRADWARFPHLLIWHGRRVCDARDAPLRGLRPRRPLPFEPGEPGHGRRPGARALPEELASRLARRDRDEQPAVLVVRREEVGADDLRQPARVRQRQLLVEAADAVLERERGRRRAVALGLEERRPSRPGRGGRASR